MASQIARVVSILKKTYPDAKIVLNYGNNWELLVAVILSAQCTDIKVNEVTAKLFPKFRAIRLSSRGRPSGRGDLISARLPRRLSASSGLLAMTGRLERQEVESFASVSIEEFERDIKSTGFYRNKAKNIQAAAKMILEKFGGKLPQTMARMLTIPGVARKTANVVLGNAYGVVEGIAIDTHVLRLSQRLGLVSRDKIGGGNKPLYYITPAVRSPLPKLSASRRGVATAGFGRSNDILSQAPKYRDRPKNLGSSEKRLDYYKDASPEKVERELMKVIPRKDWFKLTYLLIDHGRAICAAQKPKCEICPLKRICSVSRI